MFRRSSWNVLAAVALVALGVALGLLNSTAYCQEARGSILGRVTDSTGAVIPEVTVRLVHVATGVMRNTVTNEQGNFAAPLLPPGAYQVTAEREGFKKYSQTGIDLRINDRLEINVTLELGTAAETVSVTAEAPLLETTGGSIGQVIDSKQVAELPINLGLPYDLIRLAPTVTFTQGNQRQGQPWEPGASVAYSMSGSPAKSSEITMDGAANTARDEGGRTIVPGFVPPADAVAEMKVQTASFDGTTGQTTGGLINVSLKSGTNDLHGTTYFSFLPTSLTANTFFGNKDRVPRQESRSDRWGVVVNGPVVIPKIYNGRNRTFFMYAYEGIKYTSARTQNFTVPTEAQRRGDFSSLLALGPQYQIYDPATRRAIGNGRYQQDPFPNNIIPPNRISPIATALLNPTNYPLPLTNGSTIDGENNFPRPGLNQQVDFFTHTIRLDHNFSEKHRLFLRLNKYDASFADPPYFGTESLYTNTLFAYRTSGFALDDVYSITPTFIMNTRLSDARYVRISDSNPAGVGFDLTSLGFPSSYNDSFPANIRRIPSVNMSTFASFTGTPYANLWKPQETRAAAVAFDKIQGSQSFKFGFEYRQYRQNQYNLGAAATGGIFNFDTTYTRGPFDNSPAAPRGQDLAALLLGQPSSGNRDTVATYAEQSTVWAGYIQDDWKVNRKLTMTLALRYELEGPLTERYDRSIRSFDATAAHSNNFDSVVAANYARNPIPELPASQFSSLGGFTFAGANGQPRELFNRDKNNFMPRIGVAYNLDGKTVIRGGYGMYFGPLGQRRADVIQTNFSRTTPLLATNDNGLSFVGTLANPYPNGALPPVGAALGADTNLGQSLGLNALSFFSPDIKANRIQKWQVSIQRELPKRFMFEAGWVASYGDQLETRRNLRYLPQQYLSTSPVRDQPVIDRLTANVPNPFQGLLPGTGLNANVVPREQLLRQFPQFTGDLLAQTNEGWDRYHALQTRIERRFSNGYTFQVGYTWSKNMQATSFLRQDDANPEKVIAAQDYPHHLTANFIYELPFGRGRSFLATTNPVVSAIVSGWQVAAIWTVQSGAPVSLDALVGGVRVDPIFTGSKIEDAVLPANERTWRRWFDTSLFETRAAAQTQFQSRSLSSRFTELRGPRLNYWDMSALKNTRITEKINLQFRAEFLNALNQVWLALPNTVPSNTSFGQITSEGSVPRRIQFQFKVIF